ncbi:helix-turn-helix domain-containing protein [Nonomuraea angiospora]|uniref:winged helix-turn-helix domain-containing protein n=1 Tax=Nonomuraea angiospora TaxID=46172 RepID=UPI00333489D1
MWTCDYGGDGRILEPYISYLRRKIDSAEPPLIPTIRGVGYSLRLPAERVDGRPGGLSPSPEDLERKSDGLPTDFAIQGSAPTGRRSCPPRPPRTGRYCR